MLTQIWSKLREFEKALVAVNTFCVVLCGMTGNTFALVLNALAVALHLWNGHSRLKTFRQNNPNTH